jgi:NTP pyrophosphatase (non-canonical NTP hydrolase)
MSVAELNFDEYQQEAAKYFQWREGDSLMVPLLGLAGETGQLLTEYKKWLRDGDRYKPFVDQISEELGDILWYVSALASNAKLNLEDIANENLAKIRERWGEKSPSHPTLFSTGSFDSAFPPEEQLPNSITIDFRKVVHEGRNKIGIFVNGEQCGDPLTDNAHSEDGYRFHDVFHFAYAVVLGWSPLVRALLSCKRKSNSETDEIEDGARARFLEEGISAMIFEFAKDYDFFKGASAVDFELLKTIRVMTRGLEVRNAPYSEWQKAILVGYDAWRPLVEQGEGVLQGNRSTQSLTFLSARK